MATGCGVVQFHPAGAGVENRGWFKKDFHPFADREMNVKAKLRRRPEQLFFIADASPQRSALFHTPEYFYLQNQNIFTENIQQSTTQWTAQLHLSIH